MGKGNHWPTIASIGLVAMCIVTASHEAFGHGSACLALGGHIVLLSSSIFRCDLRSGWIDPAGPLGNLLGGTLALAAFQFVPARMVRLRLLLIVITAFSYFWEGAYLADAMARRSGDLYFFAQFMLGEVTAWERALFASVGVALYIFTIRRTSRALLRLWPDPAAARGVSRTVWLSAGLGATVAALAYRGQGLGDLRDAILEIGIASLPLLFIPGGRAPEGTPPGVVLVRSPAWIVVALTLFIVFAATLGRGIGAS
jgi:hypothetical protein